MAVIDKIKSYKEDIINSYINGEGSYKLGKKYDVAPYYIMKIINEAGIKPREKSTAKAPQYKEQILQMFDAGMSCTAIAKKLNIGSTSITRWLEKWDKDVNRYSTHRDESLIQHSHKIIELYQDGLSLQKIADEYNASTSSVVRILQDNDIDRRPVYKYTVNKNYFNKIDNPNNAYLLGLWYADGYVLRNGSIGICLVDKEHVEKIKEELQYSGPFYCKPSRVNKHGYISKENYQLQICKKQLMQDLLSHGCCFNKTHILQFPSIDTVPKHLVSHFLRGYFDGDGSISVYSPTSARASIASSNDFIKGLSELLTKMDIDHHIYDMSKSKVGKQIFITKYQYSKKFFDFIYQDCEQSLCLDRKYNLYKQLS